MPAGQTKESCRTAGQTKASCAWIETHLDSGLVVTTVVGQTKESCGRVTVSTTGSAKKTGAAKAAKKGSKK